MSFRTLNFRQQLGWMLCLMVALAAFPPLGLCGPDSASASLKPMAPQIDPNADTAHKVKPLQGSVQHSEDLAPKPPKKLKSNVGAGGFMGRLRGDARTANTEALRGRANDGNNPPLNAQATEGVGIIGVRFLLTNGKPPIINRVFPGTPAAKVGLQPNDAIVAVDGVPTYGLTKEEVYDLIIGSPGTSVNVSIERSGDFRVVSCIRMDINELTDPIVRRDYMMSM